MKWIVHYQDFWINIWNEVFKNGPSQICGILSLKNLKCFKGCIQKILLGPFLNTLSHLSIAKEWKLRISFWVINQKFEH